MPDPVDSVRFSSVSCTGRATAQRTSLALASVVWKGRTMLSPFDPAEWGRQYVKLFVKSMIRHLKKPESPQKFLRYVPFFPVGVQEFVRAGGDYNGFDEDYANAKRDYRASLRV